MINGPSKTSLLPPPQRERRADSVVREWLKKQKDVGKQKKKAYDR